MRFEGKRSEIVIEDGDVVHLKFRVGTDLEVAAPINPEDIAGQPGCEGVLGMAHEIILDQIADVEVKVTSPDGTTITFRKSDRSFVTDVVAGDYDPERDG